MSTLLAKVGNTSHNEGTLIKVKEVIEHCIALETRLPEIVIMHQSL